jgi:UDP:flavonoid glycosyltransferase YjiC (YdhE family)
MVIDIRIEQSRLPRVERGVFVTEELSLGLAGLPALVWPHDYDQRDHAARLVYHGLARRLRPVPTRIARDLRALLSEPSAPNLKWFQSLASEADPIGVVARAVTEIRNRQQTLATATRI